MHDIFNKKIKEFLSGQIRINLLGLFWGFFYIKALMFWKILYQVSKDKILKSEESS